MIIPVDHVWMLNNGCYVSISMDLLISGSHLGLECRFVEEGQGHPGAAGVGVDHPVRSRRVQPVRVHLQSR